MRRRIGVGAIQKQKLEADKFKDKGNQLQDSQFEQMTKQVNVLKENLESFADKHKSEIKKNPTFRRQFTEMCAAIGYDKKCYLSVNLLIKLFPIVSIHCQHQKAFGVFLEWEIFILSLAYRLLKYAWHQQNQLAEC